MNNGYGKVFNMYNNIPDDFYDYVINLQQFFTFTRDHK